MQEERMPEQPETHRVDAVQARMGYAIQSLQKLVPHTSKRLAQNVNELFQQELTFGDRVAIWVARGIGSWTFIIVQSLFLAGWASLNVVGWVKHWDPYPFILMNLFLSLQAAYTAPLIMMAQNQEDAKYRLMLQEDFETNRRAEEEVQQILNLLEQHGHLLELLLEERGNAKKEET